MPKTADAASMVKNWQAGMTSGRQKFVDAINRVQTNPMQAAAAKVADGTWAANTAAAAPRLQASLQAADFAGWKASTAGAGATAWSAGATKGLPKYTKKSVALAQAATAASAAAHSAVGPLEKVRAAINAFKQAAGKPLI